MDNNIREIRRGKNITQAKLAEISGISRTTIWRLETGKSVVVMTDTLEKLCSALGCPMEEVFFAHNVQHDELCRNDQQVV